MKSYFYTSSDPAAVCIVQDFYVQKNIHSASLEALGRLFGGHVAPMRDLTSHYAGGVKLNTSTATDVHWCHPDEYGYRSLRVAAKPAKGSSKEDRAAIRAEHQRLLDLWEKHCPERLNTHGYWERLGVNTGNVLLGGGIMFELEGAAYFHLGFPIDQNHHLACVAAGRPSSGWITGARELVASEFDAARQVKLKQLESTRG